MKSLPKGPNRGQSILYFAMEREWTRGAELGVWQGAVSDYLLRSLPELVLIGVDLWQRTPGPPKSKDTGECDYSQKDMEGAEAMVLAIQDASHGRFAVLKMDTVEAAALVDDDSLDFIFVDAYHSTQAVVADTTAWWPKVRDGGAIFGHDADWPSVQRALKQLGFNDHELLPGNVWLKWKI